MNTEAITRISETAVPDNSVLQPMLATAHFHDAYEAPLTNDDLTATEIFLMASRAVPEWVDLAMTFRNRIVRQLGLKAVGAMGDATQRPANDYKVGDRLGIFNVFGKTDNELLLGIDDRHLDVRVSVMKLQRDDLHRYVVSTVVHVNNLLGHLYMVPVGRIHPLVVKAMMRRARA